MTSTEEFMRLARRAMIATAATLASALVANAAALAADAAKAPAFLTGIWATDEGCKKQAAIDAGGPTGVETTPEVLTPDGYKGWEGGCTFTSVRENGPGKWTVGTDCHEAVEDWQDVESWELDGAAGRLKVTVDDQLTEFVRCDAGKETKP
jgi:hypothetical protein